MYTLQLLHYSDAEAGLLAPETAPRLAALADAFEDGYANSITLASGDLFLPGPFLAGGTDPAITAVLNAVTGSTLGGSPAPAQVDIAIHNLIGVQASTIGNHEFDLGSNVLSSAFGAGSGWVGAAFPYLSANLDFSGDTALAGRFQETVGVNGLEEASTLRGRLAPSAVITENGERIGIVAATTQILESISSPSGTEVEGFPTGPGANGETNDMALLAAQLQPVIDDLVGQGVNKVILLSHLQQLNLEVELAPLLEDVDIIVAGGSHTRLGDADDQAADFPGHTADFAASYPIVTEGADGNTTVIVNTDSEFTYLGRLVVDFDDDGDIVSDSVAANRPVNGAYASTDEMVAAAWGTTVDNLDETAYAEGTRGHAVQQLTEAVRNVIEVKDASVYGYSNVYLEGERVQVRNEETNLGNVSADANADAARDALGLNAYQAVVSIKNGGGIRSQIGTIIDNGDGTVTKVPPEVDGEVSQLDVENALRFNNRLMTFETTAQGLLNILNSPNALAPNNGGFVQVGGIRFSYDPDLPAGSRVQDVALVNALGQATAIVSDGSVLAGAPSVIRGVVLNFTAQGGDGYLFKQNAGNFRFLLEDGTVSAVVDESLDFSAAAVVPANAIGEQQAFADYFAENFATPEGAYDEADTPAALDTRIQNQDARSDTVLTDGQFLLLGSGDAETLTGSFRSEILRGFGGDDTLLGLGGDDILVGNAGADLLDGGNGLDLASYENEHAAVRVDLADPTRNTGAAAADGFVSTEGAIGTSFADELLGNSSANLLDGYYGADQLGGGLGDDIYVVNTSGDRITEAAGAGSDAIVLRYNATGYQLLAGVEVETIRVETGNDAIVGGNSFAQTIVGDAGDDVLYGFGGADVIEGGAGDDALNGGNGRDTLTGGDGGDRFRLDGRLGTGNLDFITDFAPGEDFIILNDASFPGLALGRLDADALYVQGAGLGAFDAEDRIILLTDGRLFFDPDGSGAGAATPFAQLVPGTVVQSTDFFVA